MNKINGHADAKSDSHKKIAKPVSGNEDGSPISASVLEREAFLQAAEVALREWFHGSSVEGLVSLEAGMIAEAVWRGVTGSAATPSDRIPRKTHQKQPLPPLSNP